jgi:hypothetical protein
MQKWEYEWFKESLVQEPLQRYLTNMGDQGWELVSVVHDGKSLVFFMKKPKR